MNFSSDFIKYVSFNKVVTDCTGGQTKMKKCEYLPHGTLPIIDQGQSLIAGYTNNLTTAFSGNLPVILFGDHTLSFKYINFPFVLGADGTKILSVSDVFMIKYLYYFWIFCKIPSRGYSRHFKFLKEIALPLIPLSEQHKIVEILDQADELCRKRKEADEKAAEILSVLFYKMFGDPASKTKDFKIGDVIVDTQYGTSSKANDTDNGIPVLRMNNIDYAGNLHLDNLKYMELTEAELNKYLLCPGDILFNRTNSRELVGKTGLWQGNLKKAVPASYLIRVRVDKEKALPEFIWAYMNIPFMKKVILNGCRPAIGMANINAKELSRFPLILPPIDKQRKFVQILTNIGTLRNQLNTVNTSIEKVFNTLLHKAFSGKLTSAWRERHRSELEAELADQMKAIEKAGTRQDTNKTNRIKKEGILTKG